jgi:beta-glucanase (GH16 family)
MRVFLLVLVATVIPFAPVQAETWKAVWSDEFDYTGLPDAAKWDYEEGFVRNRESQYYTRARGENCRVDNGLLTITARKEQYRPAQTPPATGRRQRQGTPQSAEYTSASLITRGKASWRYGRIEVRAKLPTGRGAWPAIWMLGLPDKPVGWPACGEIDIMENVGFDPLVIHANVHTAKYNHVKGNNKGARITADKPPAEDFHVYAIEWDAQRMDFYFDQNKYFSYENEGTGADAWPFDWPHYLILNIAIGGSWGGQKGIDDNIFPQSMQVDYVRVFEKSPQ